jgi:6-phosphogluconolactonase/glucosamine-6-phosphate isomerase/deaminase
MNERKARAAHCAPKGPVTPTCPASTLQRHADAHICLDEGSASLLG